MIISSFSLSPLFFCLLSPSTSFPSCSFISFSFLALPLFSFLLLYLKPSTLRIMLCIKNKQESLILLPSPKLKKKKKKTVPGNLRYIYVCVNISAKIHIHKRQSGLRDSGYPCRLETPCRANDPGYLQSQRQRREGVQWESWDLMSPEELTLCFEVASSTWGGRGGIRGCNQLNPVWRNMIRDQA